MDHSRCSSQWLGAVVVAAVCLAGCLCPAPTPEATSLPDTPTPSPTFEAPTKVPAFTAIPPSVPTLEVPAGTPAPSPIPPTRTPRPTPAPTMTADEEYAFVSEMLQSNGGCRLPCWWGFTPGETSWETAQTYFLSLGKTIGKGGNDWSTNYGVTFNISQHHAKIDQIYVTYAADDDKVIDMIVVVASSSPDYKQELSADMRPYILPQLLATYGQPSQVLLKTFSGVPEGLPPFHLLLYYPQQGIMVRYIDDAEKSGETLRLCPQRPPGVTLWLWSPEQGVNIADIADTGLGGFPKNELTYFRSLEEATGMSIEQFYQTFVQPNNETCLETPADLW